MDETDAKYCMIDGTPREVMLKELAIYKKALKLACEDVRCANPEVKNCDKCPLSFNSNCFSTGVKIDYYLQKARED